MHVPHHWQRWGDIPGAQLSHDVSQLRNFELQSGLLYCQNYVTDGDRWALVIPRSVRTSVLWSLHEDRTGYFGFYKTYCQARQRFWPPIRPFLHSEPAAQTFKLTFVGKVTAGTLSIHSAWHWGFISRTVTYFILWEQMDCHRGWLTN